MWKYIVGLLMMTTIAQGKDKVFLVKNGKTDFVISVDSNDRLALHAAGVVQEYTKQSTGAVLPIHPYIKQKKNIIIKQTTEKGYGTDNYSLEVIDGNLYIKGNGRGIVYAAYRYVREIIGGQKWYAGKENTWIPARSDIWVEEGFYVFAKPAFLFREVYFPTELDPEYMDWYGLHNLEELWGEWGHNFNKILPPAIYFKEHPEYYSFYNGKRQPIQLCLSNESVFQHTLAYFEKKIRENPAAIYWSISPNDDIGHCTCDQCKAMDEYDGGAQGSLIQFVNKVAARFPDKKFTTLAYLQTANAPVSTRAADNVYVMLSNIDAFKKNDIESETSANAFRRQLRDWRAKSKHIFVWDYVTQFTSYLAPFPIQGTLQKSLHYLKSEGAEGVFLQGGGGTYSDMAELNAYVLAHLVWDTDISEDELTDVFLKGYYGRAASHVKEYIQCRRENLPARSSALSIYGNPIDNRKDFLSPEAMDRYSSLLEKAEVAVEGNKLLEERVRRIGLGLDYTYLQQARFYGPHRHGVFEQHGDQWIVRPYVERKVRQFVHDAKIMGVHELSEGGLSPQAYEQEWRQIFNDGARINRASNAIVTMKHLFDPSFPANGAHTLTDSTPGYLDFSYNWLLWYGKPMDVTLELPKNKTVDSIEVNFLQDARHWIFPPKEIHIAVSKDGVHFEQPMRKLLDDMEEDYTVQKIRYKVGIGEYIKAVRVYAAPPLALPEWRFHPSKKPLIACDEIWLE